MEQVLGGARMAEKPVLQSSLGIVKGNSNRADRSWNSGYLAIGKVTKVYQKRYTADVQITGTSAGTIASSEANEGKYACRIMVNNAGYDETYGKAYGEIIPIEVGTIVLVAFLKNDSNQPVIIGTFHDNGENNGDDNWMNVLPSDLLKNSELTDGDKYRYTNITRSQDFFTIDGYGNFELASHFRSFIIGSSRKTLNEDELEYDDLSVRNPDGEVLSMPSSDSAPLSILGVIKAGVDEICDSIRFFVNGAKTTMKLMQVQRSLGQSSVIEFTKAGDISLRRNLDTYFTDEEDAKQFTKFSVTHDGKVIIRHQTAKDKYSEISTDATGKVTLNYGAGSKSSVVKLTDAGVEMTTESDIKLTSTNATSFDTESFEIKSGSWPTINGKKIIVEGDSTSDGATVKSNN